MQSVPEALLAEVRDRYGVVADSAEAIGGGTASKLWRLHSEPMCRDERIVGLVDWDEVEWGPLISELAWSVWEFGKSPAGDALVLDRALEFLSEYERAGGPVRPSNALDPQTCAGCQGGDGWSASSLRLGELSVRSLDGRP